MSTILCRIGQCPADDTLADELLDRILAALILDAEVDLLFHGEGLRWLQASRRTAHQSARFGLLALYGIGRMLAHDPEGILCSEVDRCERLDERALGALSRQYRSIW